jgi:hypothetical protein
MRRLAEAWPGPAFVPQAVAQMPWGHMRVLLNQIKGRARAGAAPSNFELTLPGEDSELAARQAETHVSAS